MHDNADSATLILQPPCGSWCFVFGLAGLGPNGAPVACTLRKDHAGEHQTTIKSWGEPVATFTILWSVESPHFDGIAP